MKRFVLTFTVLPLILLAGCKKDDVATLKSGEVSFAPITYAGNYGEYQWKPNAEAGVFMMPLAETNIENSTYKNAKYKYEAGRMVAATAGDKITFPDVGWSKFISYTPYQTNLATNNYLYNIDVLNQADYRDVDFLYSNTGAKYGGLLSDVKMVYRHMLSKLVFVFESADPAKLGAISGVKVKNMPHSTTFNFKNESFGTVSTVTNSEITLVEYAGAKAGTKVFEVIVPPQLGSANRKFIYTDAQGTKDIFILTGDIYKSGKVNTYTIKLDDLEVELGEVSVLPWGVGADDQLEHDLDVTAKFTDPVFNQWVRTTYCANISVIMVSDLANVEQVVIKKSALGTPKTIATLAGIEYFPRLRTLDVSNSAEGAVSGYGVGLQTLDVSLNKKLEVLNCARNLLTQTTINTSKNYELTTLICGGNTALTSLNLLNNVGLTHLDCNTTSISSFDFTNNQRLEHLDCRAIASLTNLNLLPVEKLRYLNFSTTGITALNVSTHSYLETLICNSNNMLVLDVSKNLALTYLQCSINQLISLDVSSNTALTYLACYNNQLDRLDVSSNTALTYLNCNINQLTSLDVSRHTALATLFCGRNLLNSLKVSGAVALTNLQCYVNPLDLLDVSKNLALTNLQCYENKLTSLDVSKNVALTNLNCRNNQLINLDISAHPNIIKFTYFRFEANPGNGTVTGSPNGANPADFEVKLPAGSSVTDPRPGVFPKETPDPFNLFKWNYQFKDAGGNLVGVPFDVKTKYTNL